MFSASRRINRAVGCLSYFLSPPRPVVHNADQLPLLVFRLQLRGGPNIPINPCRDLAATDQTLQFSARQRALNLL